MTQNSTFLRKYLKLHLLLLCICYCVSINCIQNNTKNQLAFHENIKINKQNFAMGEVSLKMGTIFLHFNLKNK